jgi:hypothetical protein
MNPILLFLGLACGLSSSLGAAPNGPVPPAPIFHILFKAYDDNPKATSDYGQDGGVDLE